ncbi:hypothetical protein Adu01nite_82260 [Paractinoplanes durhamensis]|uniref:DUF3068 domain-containing protein n=1 Tax=Paractinoplanes durhamensis TaxID=113563 RepID=A0ABQ3ZAS0_9ACTN|nr:hypothetical protein Adu01nite_82260 [Actinoplanes durhamensis]
MIVPSQKQVPTDYKPADVTVEAPGATFVAAQLSATGPQVSVQHGTLRSTTVVTPDPKAAASLDNTLIWGAAQTTTWVESSVPISQAESRIALDQVSGAAVPWAGQCYFEAQMDPSKNTGCVPGSITFTGQLYLFPFDTQKKEYQYWEGALRTALPIAYRGTEKIDGLTTYRFEQAVPKTDLPADAATMAGLLAFLAPGARTGTMSYEGSRTLWVEPMTGAIVAYQERQHREVVPDTGATVVLLDATFKYDQATAKAILDDARDGRSQLLLLGRYLPIGLLVLGVLLVLGGVLLLRRRATAGPQPAELTTAR